MKLKVEQSNQVHLNLNTNKNLKPFKVLKANENIPKINCFQDSKNESASKNLFIIDNKQNQTYKINSSIFHKNLKEKEKTSNISHNKISKDKQSESKPRKNNKSHIDFSNSISSKQNLPEIKNEKSSAGFNFTTKNKLALQFFKPTVKKSAISLRKDVNLQELSVQAPLKKPKKPSTVENWKSFLSKNSEKNKDKKDNFKNQNKENVYYDNVDNNKDFNNVENHDQQSFVLHSENNINNSENKTDDYKAKINRNLNSYLLNKQNNDYKNFDNEMHLNNQLPIQGFGSNSNKFKNGLNGKFNISTYNYANLIKNLSSNKRNNNSISKTKLNKNFNKNNNFNSNPKNKISDYFIEDININNTNSTASPNTIAKNYSTINANHLQNFGIALNPIENLNSNDNLISIANPSNIKNNILIKVKRNNNNDPNLNFNSDFQIKENSKFPSGFSPISSVCSPNMIIRSKCFSPITANISCFNYKKNRSMQNFFPENYTENNLANINNNKNNNLNSNLIIGSPNNKLALDSSAKMRLNRPKTVNGISNFKFNARINQETYKSIQDVLVTPTSYLPFSRKRDKLLELEKQSYLFQDKVEKELKIAKRREAKKIKIKTKNELSNYLMRDYFIGEKSNPVEGSKKRMKMTRDFDHDKEVQKKKKMALLKNEEYKETDQEDLSDSDEREMFDLNEEENKNKLKFNSNESNCSFNNKNSNDKQQKNKLVNNNEYFKQDESNLNTESDFNQSKISFQTKGRLDKTNGYSSSESSSSKDCKDLKLRKEKSHKKLTFVLASVEDFERKSFKFLKEKDQEFNKLKRDDEIGISGKKRNNFANRKNTNPNNDKDIKDDDIKNKKGEARKGSKFTNDSKEVIIRRNSKMPLNNNTRNNHNNNYNITQNSEEQNKESSKALNEQNPLAAEALFQQESSKCLLSKKISFIKNLPLEKLQELINTKKKKLENHIFEGIKMRSEIKADQILEISLNDYSDVFQDSSDEIEGNNINVDNLHRVIRVRNILKGKHKDKEQKERYKKIDIENEDEINKIIRFRKLGPPSFLKTHFKKETNMKFKMLGGKFFGCQV